MCFRKWIGATLVCSLFFVQAACGEEIKKPLYRGFVGGMLLHLGYVQSGRYSYSDGAGEMQTAQIRSMTKGIGGRILFQFGDHYRLGTEGYSTTATYDHRSSYQSIGWGGLVNEFTYKIGRWTPFAGVTIGGGGVTHLIVLEDDKGPLTSRPSIYDNYGVFIVNPTIGCQYALTNKLHLVLKLDYMLSPTMRSHADFVSGPRLYFGILFNSPSKKNTLH